MGWSGRQLSAWRGGGDLALRLSSNNTWARDAAPPKTDDLLRVVGGERESWRALPPPEPLAPRRHRHEVLVEAARREEGVAMPRGARLRAQTAAERNLRELRRERDSASRCRRPRKKTTPTSAPKPPRPKKWALATPAAAASGRAATPAARRRPSREKENEPELPKYSSQSKRLKAPRPISAPAKPAERRGRAGEPKPAPPPPPIPAGHGQGADQMMVGGATNPQYWDDVADDYDEEIMDTLAEDVTKVLRKRVRECARKLRRELEPGGALVGLDAGCGVGKWLPFLAGCCDDLTAVDVSPKLLDCARRDYDGAPPCAFAVADLTKREALAAFPAAHLCVSANVLIAPDLGTCGKILATTLDALRPSGYLVLLVPSNESARMVANTYAKYRAKKKKLGPSDRRNDFRTLDAVDVANSVWKRWGVRTQCYTLAALRDFVFAAPHDVEVERVDRVFYPWDTELNDVRIPRAEPRPYDWCAVVRKLDAPPETAAPSRPSSASRAAPPRRERPAAPNSARL